MVGQIEKMPEGCLGFQAAGKLTVEDVRDHVMPPISKVLDQDGELRIVFVMYDDFEVGFDPRVIWEDLKADFNIVGRHGKNLKRSAMVTNIDWIRRWMKLMGWAAPGDTKLFELSDVDAAKEWAAG